jgi:hypothetical protein
VGEHSLVKTDLLGWNLAQEDAVKGWSSDNDTFISKPKFESVGEAAQLRTYSWWMRTL